MGDEKLNTLAKQYLAGQVDFNELYETLNAGWFRKQREQDFHRYPNERHEVTAMYDDSIIKALEGFREDFASYLKVSLKHGRGKLRQRIRRKEVNEISIEGIEDDSETGAPTPAELRAPDPFERAAEKEKARNQRQLISELAVGADGFTQTVVKLFSRYNSMNALAKALGVHHSKVSRSIRRMSRGYDANRYGNLYDLLA